jgi:hypothetical protein
LRGDERFRANRRERRGFCAEECGGLYFLCALLPLKVIGAGDGQWHANAWKTDAFYGNPLSGFSAPYLVRCLLWAF